VKPLRFYIFPSFSWKKGETARSRKLIGVCRQSRWQIQTGGGGTRTTNKGKRGSRAGPEREQRRQPAQSRTEKREAGSLSLSPLSFSCSPVRSFECSASVYPTSHQSLCSSDRNQKEGKREREERYLGCCCCGRKLLSVLFSYVRRYIVYVEYIFTYLLIDTMLIYKDRYLKLYLNISK